MCDKLQFKAPTACVNYHKAISRYGVHTGFGYLSDHVISPDKLEGVPPKLFLSHAVGVGAPFDRSVAQPALLIRANTLSRVQSGMGIPIVDTLMTMIDRDVVPLVPSQGTLASSGNLAPLVHVSPTRMKFYLPCSSRTTSCLG